MGENCGQPAVPLSSTSAFGLLLAPFPAVRDRRPNIVSPRSTQNNQSSRQYTFSCSLRRGSRGYVLEMQYYASMDTLPVVGLRCDYRNVCRTRPRRCSMPSFVPLTIMSSRNDGRSDEMVQGGVIAFSLRNLDDSRLNRRKLALCWRNRSTTRPLARPLASFSECTRECTAMPINLSDSLRTSARLDSFFLRELS